VRFATSCLILGASSLLTAAPMLVGPNQGPAGRLRSRSDALVFDELVETPQRVDLS